MSLTKDSGQPTENAFRTYLCCILWFLQTLFFGSGYCVVMLAVCLLNHDTKGRFQIRPLFYKGKNN